MNRHLTPSLLAAIALMGPQNAALAQDAVAGREKAKMCISCHGPLGLSQMPGAPNLAGQPEIYLSSQLRAFRGGSRQHQIMTVIARDLTDADINNLSAWFSSLEITVKEP